MRARISLFFGFIGAEPRGQGGRLRGSAAATAAVVVVVVARTRGGGAAVGVRREGGRHRRSPVGPAPRRPLLAAHRATCSKLNTGFEALAAGTEARRGGRWDGLHVYAAERFVSTEVWISGGGVVFGRWRFVCAGGFGEGVRGMDRVFAWVRRAERHM
jgi:hypothetical protein